MVSLYKINIFCIIILLVLLLIIVKKRKYINNFYIILALYLLLFQIILYMYKNGMNKSDTKVISKLLVILMNISLSVYLVMTYKAYSVIPFMILFLILNVYVLVNDIEIYTLAILHLVIIFVIFQYYNINNYKHNFICILFYLMCFIILTNKYVFINISIASIIYTLLVLIIK